MSISRKNSGDKIKQEKLQPCKRKASACSSVLDEHNTQATSRITGSNCPPLKRGKLNKEALQKTNNKEERNFDTFERSYYQQHMISSGVYSKVYTGIRFPDGMKVAIKRINKDNVKKFGEIDGRTVPLEFQMLKKIQPHKGIIQMLDWYEGPEEFILVMERPRLLIDLLKCTEISRGVDEDFAKYTFKNLLAAISHCHANGVVHRDIQLDNVIINKETDEMKLIGFGSSALLKETAYTDIRGNNLLYPPEWFTTGEYSARQFDVWSLGVLLFSMVENRHPFAHVADIAHKDIEFKSKRSVSQSCKDIVLGMLEKDPTKRLTIDDISSHEWLAD